MWDERYSDEDYVYGTEPNDFLAEVVGDIPAGRTLCLAEGEGRNAVFLAAHGHDVLAVDASAVGLAKAEKLAAQRGVHIRTRVQDLAHLQIESCHWDAIVSIFCHVPPAIRKPLHRKVVAGLKPGGMLVLESYTPAQIEHGTGGPPDAALTMTSGELERELEGLEFIRNREQEREVIEGKYHTGHASVVQVIARKPVASP